MAVIGVNYGHNGGGKLYDYETEKNYRAGDIVVVPVTHKTGSPTYNTLAIVRRTTASSANVERLKDNLDYKNIKIKNVASRLEVAQAQGQNVTNSRQVNITTLPGYGSRVSDDNWSGRQPASRVDTSLDNRYYPSYN